MRKNCRVIFFFSFAFITLILIIAYCMTAFENGTLDTGCFTSGIELSPSSAYALTSTMYLWNQIKFYRVKGQVSESEERENQMKKKYMACTIFHASLGIGIIITFAVTFF